MKSKKISPKDGMDAQAHRGQPRNFYKQVSIIDLEKGEEVCIARWYATTGEWTDPVTCCVWLGDRSRGSAEGDEEDAALEAALASAGYEFDDYGAEFRGDDALYLLAHMLGAKRTYMVEAHS